MKRRPAPHTIRLILGLGLILMSGCSPKKEGDSQTTKSPDIFIAGTVRNADGNGLTDVAIQVQRPGEAARPPATTGSTGYYYVGGLNSASYSVTPTLQNYTFSPASSNVTAPRSDLDFTAIKITTPVYGLNFSPYMTGQSPNSGSIISEAQIRSRLALVLPFTKWVRTYAMNHGLENTPRIAHELGLKTAVGAWLSEDIAANAAEMDALIAAAKAGYVDLAIIGSETLFRKSLSETALIGYLNQFRNAVPAVKVTTADDSVSIWQHPNVIAACDVLFVNSYPYWGGIGIDDAMSGFNAAFELVHDMSGGKPIYVSETGWPSAGATISNAVPSTTNAARYFMDLVTWAESNPNCAGYFCFEAFDEEWKSAAEGEVGAHWGLWDKDGILKPGMGPVFEGKRTPGSSTGPFLFNITSVPASGSSNNLVKGTASGVAFANYKVAIYIQVGGGWWTKPYFAAPLTSINFDGRWECNVITGGSDSSFTQVAAYLVPSTYQPPTAAGGALPRTELLAPARAEVIKAR